MISIDVTNTMLHVVSGKASGSQISVQAYTSVPLPEHVRADGSSDITRAANTLKEIASGDFKGNEVSILFSETIVNSHQFELPYEKNPNAMLNIVHSGISQTMSTDDYIMDYVILDVFLKEKSPFCTVQVYLAPRAIVRFAEQVIEAAGKKPRVFQVSENCLYNLQNTCQGFGTDRMIAASIGSARINVILLSQAARVLMRSSPVMGDVEAYNQVLTGTYEPARAIDTATEQISKMIQYQSIKQPGQPMEHIYIFGDYATPETAQAVSASLGVPVNLLPQPGYITAPSGFSFEKYAYAVGALIEK